ncbi:sensor histidine kinase [Ectothiorhodospira marina]|uniref:histidine kinase n=1 Tax=Ectothiorhodospira marina TaxID=1396821 RepID=A0A1H7FN97_9GAMM|nr:ATP-binding protein [Ectothiorhodospira marina]SEK27573.1 Histidine kinase-, DNA gyrase B-, and HSP90-like ATPase [Ectothiorhodospira marina]
MVEITRALDLNAEQEALIDMHSFLNVLNILACELDLMAYGLGDSRPIQEALALVHEFANALQTPERAAPWLADPQSLQNRIHTLITQGLENTTPDAELRASVDNIESVLAILGTRVRELEARSDKPLGWTWLEVDPLRMDFWHLLMAIEKNSKGRYRIIQNIAEQQPEDYLIKVDIDSLESEHLYVPAIFQDVMRDLLANARKYTPPGGRILAGLKETDHEVRFVVDDTGVGIPPHQIEDIVEFGVRGENVRDRPTRGGGFGLTKAYWVVSHCNGRMWIDSDLGVGTRIEIALPRPSPQTTPPPR